MNWSVNQIPGGNATVGTIDRKGRYTAPSLLPNPYSVIVTATSPFGSATVRVSLYNPVPIVTSISPDILPVGNFSLTIHGGKFVNGARVLFAGRALQTVFRSATQLTATGVATQAQVGNLQISVKNPDPGSATSTTAFNVQVTPPPTIQISVSPSITTLRARDIQPFQATLRGTSNRAVIWSVNGVIGGNPTVGLIDTKGLYTAPATRPNPNSVKVTATSAAEHLSSASASLTLLNAIPVLTSASPTNVSVGAFTLAVNGGGFAKGSQVLFGGKALQTVFSSATQLVVTGTATQSQVGNVEVFVTNPDPGSASSTAALNIQVIEPSDTSQVPSQDPAGIFDGEGNFDAAAYVKTAKAYGTTGMINERFGNSWTAYHSSITAPTWMQAPILKYIKATNPGEWFYYSRGVPCTTVDDYSSNYAQVAFIYHAPLANPVFRSESMPLSRYTPLARYSGRQDRSSHSTIIWPLTLSRHDALGNCSAALRIGTDREPLARTKKH